MFDSSTSYRLPNGSVLSPDLVVELVRPNHKGPRRLNALRRKMDAYQANRELEAGPLFPGQRIDLIDLNVIWRM